jgi:hypothetical protein
VVYSGIGSTSIPPHPSPFSPSILTSISNNASRDHDEYGPAGPSAFWKVSNEIDDKKEHNHWDTEDDDEESDDYVEDSDEELQNVELVVGGLLDEMEE